MKMNFKKIGILFVVILMLTMVTTFISTYLTTTFGFGGVVIGGVGIPVLYALVFMLLYLVVKKYKYLD